MTRTLILASLLLAGCSKHIPVTGDAVRDEINHRAAHKRATVVLVDGTRLRRQSVELGRTALRAQGPVPGELRTIPLDSLQNLDFRYHLLGAGRGLLAGAGLAAVLRLPDHLDGQASGGLVFDDRAETLMAVTALGTLGAAGGLITGYTYSFRFADGVQPPLDPRWQSAPPDPAP